MMKIESPRLILRSWKESDIAPFASMNQDPKVMEFFLSISSPEESEAMANRFQKQIDDKGYGPWAVELKSTGEFIGFIGLLIVAPHFHFAPAIEAGWRLSQKHWGQGLATEGAIEVLQIAFEDLNLEEVVSMTAALNLPSQRVMQKIGMNHLAADDFNHPKIEQNHPLCKHVLFRAKREIWSAPNSMAMR